MVNETMLRRIQKYTIAEAERQLRHKWMMTLEELEAFIGLLYARGLMGAKNIPIPELWSEKWGNGIFRRTMARDRFIEIMKFLRFDEKSTRQQRLPADKFALFSEIWNLFISNCQEHYTPVENLAVDEQLFPTKARCRFTQYMGNKPDKFGIKFWMLAEVDSKYFLCGIPYLGKDENRMGKTLAEHVVLQLLQNYTMKGYNVTADNFFSQLPLIITLRKQRTTFVGTVRSNRRELPMEAVSVSKERVLYSTDFYVEENGILLTSYKAKSTKNVLLLSSRHEYGSVSDESAKMKPNTIRFYNDTKFGVDALDNMCKTCTVKSGVRRWPLATFFNMLDLAAINAFILYKFVTGKRISRRTFLKMLVEDLVDISVKRVQPPPIPLESVSIHLGKRKQCAHCRNKTSEQCSFCMKAVCGKCTAERQVQIKCKACP
jgi:hypothetical protein